MPPLAKPQFRYFRIFSGIVPLVVLLFSDSRMGYFWASRPMLTSLLASLVSLAFAVAIVDKYIDWKAEKRRGELYRSVSKELLAAYTEAVGFLKKRYSFAPCEGGSAAGDYFWLDASEAAEDLASRFSDLIEQRSYLIASLGVADYSYLFGGAVKVKRDLFSISDSLRRVDYEAFFSYSSSTGVCDDICLRNIDLLLRRLNSLSAESQGLAESELEKFILYTD